MSWRDRLAERQMLKALGKGELDNLEGAGAPLPQRPGDAFVTAADAAGFRIMAQAGVLPEEISLKKQADALRAQLAALTDPGARRRVMADLAQVEMRASIAAEARRRFLKS
jgi:hypothetical protein